MEGRLVHLCSLFPINPERAVSMLRTAIENNS